jgi:Na+/H+ antiporter NhaB
MMPADLPLANRTAEAMSWVLGAVGGRDRQSLLIEMTVTCIVIMLTLLVFTRIVPYVTSGIAFFIKFCLCSAVLSLCLQFVKASALYKTTRVMLSYVFP